MKNSELIGCLGLIPAAIIGFVVRGWALTKLWGWFLTPIFHILPPSWAVAIGIGMLVSGLIGYESPSRK